MKLWSDIYVWRNTTKDFWINFKLCKKRQLKMLLAKNKLLAYKIATFTCIIFIHYLLKIVLHASFREKNIYMSQPFLRR